MDDKLIDQIAELPPGATLVKVKGGWLGYLTQEYKPIEEPNFGTIVKRLLTLEENRREEDDSN